MDEERGELENALPAGEMTPDGHDRLFVPQVAWTTGLLGVQDMAFGPDQSSTGRLKDRAVSPYPGGVGASEVVEVDS